MKTKIFLILFLLQFIITTGQAQDSVLSVSTNKFSIHSISLTASWYNPSMNYWNNTFLPAANSAGKFNGNILFGGTISFNLPLNLGARVGAWYWQENVSGGANASFNTLRIGFTDFSIGAFYRYPEQIIWEISPYAGIDWNYFLIQNSYNVNGDVSKMSGYNIAGTPFIGIERVFFKNIILGVEYGYMVGGYRQNMDATTASSSPWNSINGSKIGLTLGYKFP